MTGQAYRQHIADTHTTRLVAATQSALAATSRQETLDAGPGTVAQHECEQDRTDDDRQ